MRINISAILVGLGMVLVSCQAVEKKSISDDIATITAISAERAKAFNEGNANGIATHFTDDAYLMAPESETKRGKEAIQAYYQAIFDEFESELESGYEDVKIDGNLAYGRGFAKVWLTPKSDGEKIYSESKYLNILERQSDGTWKTTHDIWNGNE
ncbi:SgcJ/EcaC family oxidoreductase [Aquiflexum sp.]|uniref:YybH family protein n=1 Tax=Aquiflexum sp. TaxID=1872584 RepID=UPI00359315D8